MPTSNVDGEEGDDAERKRLDDFAEWLMKEGEQSRIDLPVEFAYTTNPTPNNKLDTNILVFEGDRRIMKHMSKIVGKHDMNTIRNGKTHVGCSNICRWSGEFQFVEMIQ